VITVLRAPPFATVQDLGRPGHLEAGVPTAGALDRFSLAIANLLVGNPRGAAGLEWGLGGGTLRFECALSFALAGAHAEARLGSRSIELGNVAQAAPGDVLDVHRPDRGAWLYVTVAGGIDVPLVLGSRSTYLPGRFGGIEGRILRSGDRLPVGVAPERRAAEKHDPLHVSAEPRDEVIRILPGPDRGNLSTGEWDRFLDAEYRVSRAASRMGYRLEVAGAGPSVAQDRPSAPVCLGTVQLPAGGEPIVLLADGPTVGGYSRIAVVASADVGRLAQRRPGDPVRLRPIDLVEARRALRDQMAVLDRLESGA
jgi:antagonist of KipI